MCAALELSRVPFGLQNLDALQVKLIPVGTLTRRATGAEPLPCYSMAVLESGVADIA